MKRLARTLIQLTAVGVVGITWSAACNSIEGCEYTGKCTDVGGAGQTSGNGGAAALGGGAGAPDGGTPSGGAASGGTTNVGEGGAAAGAGATAGAPPCNGACGGATPACDEISGLCVGCTSPSDCPGQAPVCKPSTNTCVGCLTPSDCAKPNPACDPATNTCVECMSAGDCSGTTPLCDPTGHVCVACLQQTDCTDPAAPNCAAATHTCRPCTNSTQCTSIPGKPLCLSGSCVECTKQADCTSPNASQCDATTHTCKACTTDAHCSNIAGKGVCLDGACVQCTAAKPSACGTDTQSGTAFVCDSLKHTCTTSLAKSSGLCAACVSDAQCKPGELCVLDTVGTGAAAKSVGYFCHWKKGDTTNGAPADCFATGRPYAGTLTGAASIDGQTADICSLRVSSCPASSEFSTKNCAPTGTPNDSLCGVAAPTDAKCIQVTASSAYRCTMTCLSGDDCPDGSACDAQASPRVCQF